MLLVRLKQFSLALFCLVAAGCGQAGYEARMNETLEQIEHEAKFNALRVEPVPIPGTPYKIRLPNAFFNNATVYTPESPNPLTGLPPIPLEMLQPPLVQIPGVHAVYQAAAMDERGVRLPFFLYMASIEEGQQPAQPAEQPQAEQEAKPANEAKPADKAAESEKKADEGENKPAGESEKAEPEKKPAKPAKPPSLQERLLEEMNKAFPSKTPAKWETVECETPQKARIPWQRLLAEGEQNFQFLNLDIGEKLPGKFLVYLFKLPEQPLTVILAWRGPDAIAAQAPVDQWAERAAGTLTGF